MSGGGPSQAEVKAVRKALKSRNVHLEDHFITIQTSLHTTGDPSEGPPEPGTETREELIERCHLLADEIRKVRDAVGAVSFDAADKQALRSALAATAKGWDARGELLATNDAGRIQQAQQVAEKTTFEAGATAAALEPYFVES